MYWLLLGLMGVLIAGAVGGQRERRLAGRHHAAAAADRRDGALRARHADHHGRAAGA